MVAYRLATPNVIGTKQLTSLTPKYLRLLCGNPGQDRVQVRPIEIINIRNLCLSGWGDTSTFKSTSASSLDSCFSAPRFIAVELRMIVVVKKVEAAV